KGKSVGHKDRLPGIALVVTDGDVRTLAGGKRDIHGAISANNAIETEVREPHTAYPCRRWNLDCGSPCLATIDRLLERQRIGTAGDHINNVRVTLLQVLHALGRRPGEDLGVPASQRAERPIGARLIGREPGLAVVVAAVQPWWSGTGKVDGDPECSPGLP